MRPHNDYQIVTIAGLYSRTAGSRTGRQPNPVCLPMPEKPNWRHSGLGRFLLRLVRRRIRLAPGGAMHEPAIRSGGSRQGRKRSIQVRVNVHRHSRPDSKTDRVCETAVPSDVRRSALQTTILSPGFCRQDSRLRVACPVVRIHDNDACRAKGKSIERILAVQ